jgi:nitrate reductase assembly molybdenum cofactor insertion protein NarJ
MLGSIRSASSLEGAASAAEPGPVRQAARELTKALRSEDLEGARRAYAGLVSALPDGLHVKAGTPLAEVGKALAQGDIAAARSAYVDVFRNRRPQPEAPAPAVPSSTGGTAGSVVNLVA